jgi:lipopolysaccharide/colanic/teichoic acid biosynthesis glycosyltransferase
MVSRDQWRLSTNGVLRGALASHVNLWRGISLSQQVILGSKPSEAICPVVSASETVAREVSYALWKRLFDIIGASIIMLVFFPVFLLIALAVRLTSKGPIFYKSYRVGLAGELIEFVKFRTMVVNADEKLAELLAKNEKDGPIFKIKHDPRITPIGRILRKYSLDEFPQIYSVLKGDMSLVGPRPPLQREVEAYDQLALQRLTIKPGITCYWQVMGRSDLSFEEMVTLDLKYIEEMSFWIDLKILFMTPLAVLRGQGAY